MDRPVRDKPWRPGDYPRPGRSLFVDMKYRF